MGREDRLTLPSGFLKTGKYCGECNEEMLYSYITDKPMCKVAKCKIGRNRPQMYGEGKVKYMIRRIRNVMSEVVGQ